MSSSHYGSLETFGLSIHFAQPALPSATRPPATARPCHARLTYHPSVSPATHRPTAPNSASGGHEKPLPVTARALPGKTENRKKVEILTQLLAFQVYCCAACCCTAAALLRCCCGLVGTYGCTAVVLLWSVGRWVESGWSVLGDWRLARSPRCRGVVKKLQKTSPRFSTFLKTPEPMLLAYQCTAVPALLYCCYTAAVLLLWVGR